MVSRETKGLSSPQLDAQFMADFYEQVQAKELAKLNQLSSLATQSASIESKQKQFEHMSLKQLMRNTVDVLVAIITDLTERKPLADVFLAEERVLYVGLVLIILAICIYLVDVTS